MMNSGLSSSRWPIQFDKNTPNRNNIFTVLTGSFQQHVHWMFRTCEKGLGTRKVKQLSGW